MFKARFVHNFRIHLTDDGLHFSLVNALRDPVQRRTVRRWTTWPNHDCRRILVRQCLQKIQAKELIQMRI